MSFTLSGDGGQAKPSNATNQPTSPFRKRTEERETESAARARDYNPGNANIIKPIFETSVFIKLFSPRVLEMGARKSFMTHLSSTF